MASKKVGLHFGTALTLAIAPHGEGGLGRTAIVDSLGTIVEAPLG